MKIRTFRNLRDGVFGIRVQTEDWSENDKSLMVRFGEPEIDLGGTFAVNVDTADSGSSDSSGSSGSSDSSDSSDPIPEPKTVNLPTVYARVMTESPFLQKFDTRDIGSVADTLAIARLWSGTIETRITRAVLELRGKDDSFTTEEVSEV